MGDVWSGEGILQNNPLDTVTVLPRHQSMGWGPPQPQSTSQQGSPLLPPATGVSVCGQAFAQFESTFHFFFLFKARPQNGSLIGLSQTHLGSPHHHVGSTRLRNNTRP